MPSNKKHHFVPKFYLKNFSKDNKSINIYNIPNDKIIPKGNLKNQCYKDYFYGKDGNTEKMLGKIETAAANILKEVIECSSPPTPKTTSHTNLLINLLIQYGRTSHTVDTLNELVEGYTRNFIELIEEIPGEYIDLIKVGLKEPAAYSVAMAADTWHIASDLEYKLLIAKDGSEFITSDNPVVLYNQIFEQFDYLTAIGLYWKGLQIFYPVCPNMLLVFYDSNCYKIGKKREASTKITEQRDMDALNALQIVNASENIYFSKSEAAGISRLKAFTNLRSKEKTRTVIYPSWETEEKRAELHITSKATNKIGLTLGCIKQLDKAKSFIKEIKASEKHSAFFPRNHTLIQLDQEYRKERKNGKPLVSFFDFIKNRHGTTNA